jgi:5'-3' exonuclease
MGIKNFYHGWFKHRFKCTAVEKPDIDVLAMDINGLFYNCSQQVCRHEKPIMLFKKVCENIDIIRRTINPQKKFIICVDGVAGLGKMNQQRLRRQRANRHIYSYNTNCFTPGTELLDNMTRYIDWYIRNMISCSPEWQNIEIIFSNEKVPGEGEHKIMKYIKSLVPIDQSICIYGCDADLILLTSLLSHTNVHIARECKGKIDFINISEFKTQLVDILRWDGDRYFNDVVAIQDFVFILSLVGNDFIPPISCLSIVHGAMDIIINAYIATGTKHGHITYTNSLSFITIHNISLFRFFKNMSLYEKRSHVSSASSASSYIDGMIWTINYYKNGIPDWRWCFETDVPLLKDLSMVSLDYIAPCFVLNKPMDPLLQLMILLPKSDQYLLPNAMHGTFTFYPIHKILGFHEVQEIERVYRGIYEPLFTMKERKRNQIGKVFKYIYCCQHYSTFKSFFGDINCKIIVSTINI